MKKRTPWLALACVVFTTPAFAQSAAPTRAEEARAIRESKASAPPAPAQPGKVERFLNWVETGPLFQNTVRDGLGVRIGGIENGAGLAFGPAWRMSNVRNGAVELSLSGALSITRDHEVSASIGAPQLASDRLALGLNVETTHLAQERFYGRGMSSAHADATAFALDSRRAAVDATLTATRWLRLTGSVGTLNASTADAQGRRAVPISARFDRVSAPGLGLDHRFAIMTLGATADFRDVPQNPRRGGRYHVVASRYAGMQQEQNAFTRVDAEVEQHLSAWKRQRLITLRAFASTTLTAKGHEVPFFLQPTLGGSRLLRGFVTDRFRDRSLLGLQAEYGWDITPFLNAVLFYETGAVASSLRAIKANEFRKDYGIGFRFGSARTVTLRTDIAFGSGEGTRVTMRFNHAF